MRALRRLSLLALPGALLFLTACGQTPEETEKARGVLTGAPVVLAMSILFVVLAVGALGAAVVVDRAIRSRKALVEGGPVVEEDEEDEQPEVVAGITVGRAAVPRWLYGAYVLIPVFALAYVLSNVAVAPAPAAEATPTPEAGPCTECEIAAAQIVFDKDELVVAAGEEITVTFHNNDAGVPHDFTVWADEADAAGGDSVATTGQVGGGASRDMSFNADEATYFNCTIHPASMFGDVVAE